MSRKGSGLSVTDLFCGAGGSSLGMHHASDGVEITLALNHWRLAIETHAANFEATAHDCVDVSATDPRRYRSTTVLWASPSCTNHSLAKGQKRRHDAQMELFGKVIDDDDAAERSRATMFDVPRFAEYHDQGVVVSFGRVSVRLTAEPGGTGNVRVAIFGAREFGWPAPDVAWGEATGDERAGRVADLLIVAREAADD